MILMVFAARDKAVEAFLPPFFARSVGEAVRSFTDACQDPNGAFHKHAEDFELYLLDHWDDAQGTFAGRSPEKIITGLAILSQFVSPVSQ